MQERWSGKNEEERARMETPVQTGEKGQKQINLAKISQGKAEGDIKKTNQQNKKHKWNKQLCTRHRKKSVKQVGQVTSLEQNSGQAGTSGLEF